MYDVTPAVDHLTPEEVLQIIGYMADCDPVVVGGQTVNIWASYYSARDPGLVDLGPFTSKDVDVFSNPEAAKRLADHLGDSRIKFVGVDDHVSPNAATVVGNFGKRRILVDFMARVMGVDEASITGDYVAIAGRVPGTDQELKLLLMNPHDCVRSRFSNINQLHRRDDVAIRQAAVSLRVLKHFVDDLLDAGETRKAQRILHDFQFVIRDNHLGLATHRKFGYMLDPFHMPMHFLSDVRLDERWRDLILAKLLARLRDRASRNEDKEARMTHQSGRA